MHKFPPIQKKRLISLINNLLFVYDLTNADVYGHNELNKSKTCPNFDVEEIKRELTNGRQKQGVFYE